MAPAACAGGRFAGHGLSALPFLPDARGSGVPQTKAALYARGGRNQPSYRNRKFLCTSATLASGLPLGREGPAVQVGSGMHRCWAEAGPAARQSEGPDPRRGSSGDRRCVQYTAVPRCCLPSKEVVGDLHAPVLDRVVLASATSWAMLRLSALEQRIISQQQLQHRQESLRPAPRSQHRACKSPTTSSR